jgi:hypothetical protein
MAEGEVDINGYVYLDGVQAPIVDASVSTDYGPEFVQDVVRAELVDATGRHTTLDLDRRHTLARWDVTPSFNFSDTMFTGTLGGRHVRAYVEYTWPRAYLDHVLSRAAESDVRVG